MSVRSVAKGRVSLLDKGMGKKFYIGNSNKLRMTSPCVHIPPRTLTDSKQWMECRPRLQPLLSLFKQVIQAHLWLANREADAGLPDDDDDIDESAIPGFSHPTMRPNTPPLNKGKSRAPEQLALPTGSGPASQPSGNIGTPVGGTTRGVRQNFGGVQVESRSCMPYPSLLGTKLTCAQVRRD
jgi:hypothetical protein